MTQKRKKVDPLSDPRLTSVAAMKFWSRFKNPRPTLAFAFAEPADVDDVPLQRLARLPEVPADKSTLYLLKISLDHSKPAVWRRVLTPSITLFEMHSLIQTVMGWTDSHLHGFDVRQVRVPSIEDGAVVSEETISIAQLLAARIKTFHYTYDFGDDWQHTISIESIRPLEVGQVYPKCLAGAGACPLEDVGGIDQWSQLLDVLQHQALDCDESMTTLLARVGRDFSPEQFELADVNQRLANIIRNSKQDKPKR